MTSSAAPTRPALWWERAAAILLGGAALWAAVGYGLILGLRNTILLPAWMLIGAIALPLALVALVQRALPQRLAPSVVLACGAGGGLVAVLIGGALDAVDAHVFGSATVVLAAAVGEEAAKAATALWLMRHLRIGSTRDALIVGAAVGFGYAAIESLGYGIAPFLGTPFDGSEVLASSGVQAIRAALAPFGHPVWTALITAEALTLRSRPLRAATVIVATMLVHALWDGGLQKAVTRLDMPVTITDERVFAVITLLSAVAAVGGCALLLRVHGSPLQVLTSNDATLPVARPRG